MLRKIFLTLVILLLVSSRGFADGNDAAIKLTADSTNSDSIKISWTKLGDGTVYKLFKKEGDGDFNEIKANSYKIYYNSDWSEVYIHYGTKDGWTTAPGIKMNKETEGEYIDWYVYTIYGSPFVSLTFNNGNGDWDNNSGKNYKLDESGVYKKGRRMSAFERIADFTQSGFMNNEYNDISVKPSTAYQYKVVAYDQSGKLLGKSNVLSVTTLEKEFSIYPYLTWNSIAMSSTGIVINFETEDIGTVEVTYGTDQDNLVGVEVSEDKKIHHVEINGLQPDTTYYYEIQTDSLKGNIYNFTTSRKNPEKFAFALINDIQDGVDYNDPPRRWKEVADLLSQMIDIEQLDFIVAPGDLVSESSNIDWKIFFDKGRDLLPYIVIMPTLGNHDTSGDDTHSRDDSNYFGEKVFKERFEMPGDKTWYEFIYGNALFIALDTEVLSDTSTMLETEQFAWIKNILEKDAENYEWVFVYHHIPPYIQTSRHKNQADGIRPLTQYFDGKVDWDFGAHVHTYQRFKPIRYNESSPTSPRIESEYGRGASDGVGYMVLGPSGNQPEAMPADDGNILAYPTNTDISKGKISEVVFTLVNIDKKNIKIETFGIGSLVKEKTLHVVDKVEYTKK